MSSPAELEAHALILRGVLWRAGVNVVDTWVMPDTNMIGLVFRLPDGVRTCCAMPDDTTDPRSIIREWEMLLERGAPPSGQLLTVDPKTGAEEWKPLPANFNDDWAGNLAKMVGAS